jgi:hypothetical protein
MILAKRRARRDASARPPLTSRQFGEQRAFWSSQRQLSAAICSRRAGKSRGGNEEWVERAWRQQHGRYLYINATRAEAMRIAWTGARGDGMLPLAKGLGVPIKVNNTELSICFTDIDSWIYLLGVDDEASVDKALGTPWHGVWWDEAQKIPTKFSSKIREALLPALLDYGGHLKLTGTADRKMSGLFYDVTRTESAKRAPGWDVHHWTLLHNPYWGRAKQINGQWFVVWRYDDVIHSGPHAVGEIQAAVLGCRHQQGLIGLQTLLGGSDVAPLDSSIMRRQGGGIWTKEDSNFVYDVNKVPEGKLCYAPHRLRPDNFVDVVAALKDLEGDWREYHFAMGADLGYNDPFTFTLWGWHPYRPFLDEIVSWKRDGLDSDEQNKCLQDVREHVAIGVIDADAGGIGKQVVKGWSKQWVEKYGLPIREAEKQHKLTAIQNMNTDIVKGVVRFREGSPVLEEMRELQWATLVDGTGKMVEDPTMPNDSCDGALYGHRRACQYRWRPEDAPPPPRTPEAYAREERELEEQQDEDLEDGPTYY